MGGESEATRRRDSETVKRGAQDKDARLSDSTKLNVLSLWTLAYCYSFIFYLVGGRG